MDSIITRAKQGDNDAMQEILNQYRNLIRSVANRYYLVGGDKEDLLQEAMLGVFSAVNSYDESKGAFPAFVKICVIRRVLNAVDNSNSIANKPLSNYASLSTVATRVSDNDPLEILIDKEVSLKLQEDIARLLTARERQVLELFESGYSYAQISQQLDISYKAVDGALQRAKKKLSIDKE